MQASADALSRCAAQIYQAWGSRHTCSSAWRYGPGRTAHPPPFQRAVRWQRSGSTLACHRLWRHSLRMFAKLRQGVWDDFQAERWCVGGRRWTLCTAAASRRPSSWRPQLIHGCVTRSRRMRKPPRCGTRCRLQSWAHRRRSWLCWGASWRRPLHRPMLPPAPRATRQRAAGQAQRRTCACAGLAHACTTSSAAAETHRSLTPWGLGGYGRCKVRACCPAALLPACILLAACFVVAATELCCAMLRPPP